METEVERKRRYRKGGEVGSANIIMILLRRK
jgi:hypothetical protein